MGHDVFSLGSYINPNSPQDVKRPAVLGDSHEKLQGIAIQCTKDNLHQELIDWADVIIWMHRPDWILNNWAKVKGKKCVWRSIGQSTKDVESMLAIPRSEGLKLVRYSPEERNIQGFLGEDAIIRFYKDENEFSGYTGVIPTVITVAQAMKSRGKSCGFEIFDQATKGLSRALFGPQNEDSGISGGLLSYEDLKAAYRNYQVYFYTGTYPAPYTLNFIEAMMTGIPIIAIGPQLADLHYFNGCTYEVSKIIDNETSGFYSDDIGSLRFYLEKLLSHPEECKRIGENGRKTAIKLFGKEVVREQWANFLNNL